MLTKLRSAQRTDHAQHGGSRAHPTNQGTGVNARAAAGVSAGIQLRPWRQLLPFRQLRAAIGSAGVPAPAAESPAPRFGGLPSELLQGIVGQLPPWVLLNFSRANRHLYRTLQDEVAVAVIGLTRASRVETYAQFIELLGRDDPEPTTPIQAGAAARKSGARSRAGQSLDALKAQARRLRHVIQAYACTAEMDTAASPSTRTIATLRSSLQREPLEGLGARITRLPWHEQEDALRAFLEYAQSLPETSRPDLFTEIMAAVSDGADAQKPLDEQAVEKALQGEQAVEKALSALAIRRNRNMHEATHAQDGGASVPDIMYRFGITYEDARHRAIGLGLQKIEAGEDPRGVARTHGFVDERCIHQFLFETARSACARGGNVQAVAERHRITDREGLLELERSACYGAGREAVRAEDPSIVADRLGVREQASIGILNVLAAQIAVDRGESVRSTGEKFGISAPGVLYALELRVYQRAASAVDRGEAPLIVADRFGLRNDQVVSKLNRRAASCAVKHCDTNVQQIAKQFGISSLLRTH